MAPNKLRTFYRDLTTITFNTLVLILVVNVLLFAYFTIKDRSRAYASNTITEDRWVRLQRVYENFSRKEIQDLLFEMENRTLAYAPYTEFKERPYSGKYLNLTAHGFRQVNNQGPWPPDKEKYFNVFLFGGSTTWGYGVPDDETIGSYLQEYLNEKAEFGKPVRVYNFACESYYSTQERILFEQLISANFVPDMAIFIDGFNDFWFYDDRPLYADAFQLLVDGKLNETPPAQLLQTVPMMRAATELRQTLARALKKQPAQSASPADQKYSNQDVLMKIIKRYIKGKQMIDAIAAAEGVKTLFVWQPISTYKYDAKYNLFEADAFRESRYATFGYPLMARFAKENNLGGNFLWCADIQEQTTEPLYVDTMHYTGKMSKLLAKTIADMLGQKSTASPKSR